ncbi:MAG: hypothetical protein IKE02_03885 [Lachnospiraceae bacterium]|nr:hypothetical protein [Lachnospiraceae bacterium]
MRLIDADALAQDLEYDVELCASALDDMNIVGKERDDMQWEKDCKQNCIWYISEQPTVDAVPIDWLICKRNEHNNDGFAWIFEAVIEDWRREHETDRR